MVNEYGHIFTKPEDLFVFKLNDLTQQRIDILRQ